MSVPSYLGGCGSVHSKQFTDYLKSSLHGGLVIDKHPAPVTLSLITVDRKDIDYMTSDRPDFESSVRYHIDNIRSGATQEPILVHALPDSTPEKPHYMVIDGSARLEAMHRIGQDTDIVAVENSFLGDLGSKIKKSGSGFLVKADRFGHKASDATAQYVAEKTHQGLVAGKEYGKELAKSRYYDIKESAAQTRRDIREGIGRAYSGFKERGKENLLALLSSGEIKKLLAQAQSSDLYVSSNAKRILRTRYPLVWENTPWSEQVVRHINVSETGKSYAEGVKEREASTTKATQEKAQQLENKQAYLEHRPAKNLLLEQKKAAENASQKLLIEQREHEKEVVKLAHPQPVPVLLHKKTADELENELSTKMQERDEARSREKLEKSLEKKREKETKKRKELNLVVGRELFPTPHKPITKTDK